MMLDFKLSDEQKMIRETISRFCEAQIKPFAALMDQAAEFQKEHFFRIFKGLADIGVLGLLVPETYGGSGSDIVTIALVVEEISKISPGIALSFISHTPVMAYSNIYLKGTDEQKQKYLRPMCEGKIIGANAVTEPEAGSDLFSIKTTAHADNDSYVINGTKNFITNAPVADVIFVLAKDKGTADGMSGFLIDRQSTGLSVGKSIDKCGYRSSPTSEVILENCRVPESNLLGERGKGLKATLSEIELQRILLANISTGLAQSAMLTAIKYSKERIQFGKPISEYQMIRSMIADMATDIEAAKTMNYRAALEYQELSATEKKESSLLSLMAKKFSSSVCVKAVLDSVQIHGGYGLMKEFPIERYFRDSKMLDVAGGTNEILKLLISRILLR
jgi:butyryl-CoA dehydrogenase